MSPQLNALLFALMHSASFHSHGWVVIIPPPSPRRGRCMFVIPSSSCMSCDVIERDKVMLSEAITSGNVSISVMRSLHLNDR